MVVRKWRGQGQAVIAGRTGEIAVRADPDALRRVLRQAVGYAHQAAPWQLGH
ncbi:hypothetical protein [Leisingera sp.]|uniref:hypothetical protein n=1 Tax=Leisingera sp. TaxID=1879318 RepID=UPI002B26DEE6|nr:hypothetical protein [Leisingera sp.]